MAQQRLVHIVDDVPELEDAREGAGEGPVMLVALDGFLDAGNAASLAVTHLAGAEPGPVVASFDVDELHDYRARRPPLSFREDAYTDYDAPRLAVRLQHDEAGVAYLVLSGPEPDIRWEAFARAVREVVETFRVRLVLSLGSIPMAVPHTRPVRLTNHANDRTLLVQHNDWSGDLRVPGSAQALLELRLGEWGHDAAGFVAHIPHYVAQMDYPLGAVALLEGIHTATGLTWSGEELQRAGDARRSEIDAQVAESEEVGEVVSGLEKQYDAFYAEREGDMADEPLPSGDELGAQFERFLAGLDAEGDEDE